MKRLLTINWDIRGRELGKRPTIPQGVRFGVK